LRKARGQFVEADGDSLAEVHGRLAWVGGDGEDAVAKGEVVAGEAVLLRTEDEGDAGAVGAFTLQERSEIRKRNDRLLRLAGFKRAGAEYEGCRGYGFSKRATHCCVLEEVLGADGRLGFAPVGLIWGHDREAVEAEVGHGACDGANVERVARADENDVDGKRVDECERGGLVWGGQGNIVEGARSSAMGGCGRVANFGRLLLK
jgi:hypothetical protein